MCGPAFLTTIWSALTFFHHDSIDVQFDVSSWCTIRVIGRCSLGDSQRNVVPSWWSSSTLLDCSWAIIGCVVSKLVDWSRRSPDMTPLDFYLWGNLKSVVYETLVPSEQELIGRIVEGCASWETPGIFERVRQSLHQRLNACIT